MGDLRPLGSEKLQGMYKIKRILEIAKYNETPKTDINERITLQAKNKYGSNKSYPDF